MEQVFIEDKQGNKVLPITHVDAVRDSNGNTISSIMGTFEDEVRGLVDTPHQEYVTVDAYASLPVSGSTDTIYRVSNYDGSQSQVDNSVYSEYAWNGTQYVFLCVKSAVGEVFDISAYHNNAKYTDLTDALTGTNGGVPQSLQKGGMSVKFVHTSDNKYVQYRLMATAWSTVVTDWQGIADKPTPGSDNLVNSGGLVSAYGYNKSQTVSATQGTTYYNIFTNINIKQGEKFKVKATGDAIAGNINLYINNAQGTSLGNVNVNGSAVEITAPSDIPTLYCYKYSGYVIASGSLTIEVLIEGSVINKQLEPIKTTLASHTSSINSLNTTTGTHTTDIAGLKADNTNAYGKTVVKTQAATSGSVFNCTTNFSVAAGHRYSIEVTAESGVISGPFSLFKDSAISANELGSRYAEQGPIEFIADTNITKLIVYRSATGVVGSGNVTVTLMDLGSVLSEAFERDNSFVRNSKMLLSASTGSMLQQVWAQIKAGEYFILRVIDKDNAINGTSVQTFKGPQATSANAIETFSGNNVSKIYKAEEDINWIVFYAKPATGSTFNSGMVYCEVHRSQDKDALMNELYNIEQRIENAGSSSVIVDVVNPYWSQSWQGNLIYAVTPELKGIYVKFDSITIHTGSERIVKTWSDLKTDLPSATYGVAGDNMTDTLLLSIYSYANQILYYDLKAGKFKIANDNTTFTGKYILLAYAKNGSIGGEICRQYNDSLTLNKNPYLTEPNAKYLDTLRTKEMDLLGAKKFFTFGWCSDVHYSLTENKGAPVNVTNAVMADLDNYIGFDCILNTGDNILYGSKIKRQGLDALQKTFRTIDLNKFVVSVGNHDYNSVADSGNTANKKQWLISPDELETLFFRRVKVTNRPDNKLYYYRDFDEKKVRIISLDTQDVPFEFNADDTIKYDPVGAQGLRQAQIEWLAGTALDLTGKTDAANWKILIVMHVPLYSNNGSAVRNAVPIKTMLTAFVNKTTYTLNYTDGTYDFFNLNTSGDFTGKQGKLVAVLAGHSHVDAYYNDAGFNFIQIKASYSNPYNMLPETWNEFAIDAVILDDTQQKIILKRFGNYVVSENPEGDREYSYDVNV